MLFKNYDIEFIYIVDYFDYWKEFWSDNNINKLLVGEIVVFFVKVIRVLYIYIIKVWRI